METMRRSLIFGSVHCIQFSDVLNLITFPLVCSQSCVAVVVVVVVVVVM